MNRASLWLLEKLAERYRLGMKEYGQPIGLAPSTFTTWTAPEGAVPDMTTMRGLERRGYVEKFGSGGLWRATAEGVAASERLSKIYTTK